MVKTKFPLKSASVILFILISVFFGNIIYDISPYELNKNNILLSPSIEHIFGTDRLGRDLLARVLEGGKISILIGLGSSIIASLIGLVIGISAGYFGKNLDRIFVIIIDLFLTFPTFFLLLALVSYINASALVLVFVISITGWMTTARMIRSESFSIAQKPFIKILKISGVGSIKIIFKYFAPLLAPIFFVSFTFGVSGAILAESGLSFLGIGIMSPQISWGTILSEGKEVIDIAWWVSFFPGLFIFILTYSMINISDYMQIIFNKKDIIS